MNKIRAGGVLAAVLLASCAKEAPPPPPPSVRPAKLIEVSIDDRIRRVRLPAIVGAAANSVLTFQVGGLLQDLTLAEGATVERGQLLAQLDQRDFRNALASARSQYDNALAEFERAERLVRENAISRSIFDQRKSQRDVARAALDSAQKQLDDTEIRAPFSGVVADIHVEAFENVGAQQPVLTLQSTGDAEAIVQVPASLVVNIEQLEPIDVFLELDAAPERRIAAAFVESASAADATTQTFEARFAFAPPDGLVILPGMTGLLEGRFRTPASGAQNAPAVPLSAVLAEAGETYVWRVDTSTMTVSRRPVTVAAGAGESVLVSEGLADGDVIVGAGGAYLYEGAEIRAYESD
ncbi:MAG: efflux RND transporter periplasmic adaptor subunit [Pseudomonadota bacterium]